MPDIKLDTGDLVTKNSWPHRLYTKKYLLNEPVDKSNLTLLGIKYAVEFIEKFKSNQIYFTLLVGHHTVCFFK